MPADVEDVEPDVVLVQAQDVEAVAGELVAGAEFPGEGEARSPRRDGRQPGLLDGGRLGQVPPHLFVGPPQAVLRLAPCGHVGLDADEMGDLAGVVPHGGDGQAVPERRAVLAAVEDLDGAVAAGDQGVADLLHGLRVGVIPLQELAVAVQRLLGRVAGQALEALVDVDQRTARQAGVRDGDALGGHRERPVLQVQPLIDVSSVSFRSHAPSLSERGGGRRSPAYPGEGKAGRRAARHDPTSRTRGTPAGTSRGAPRRDRRPRRSHPGAPG